MINPTELEQGGTESDIATVPEAAPSRRRFFAMGTSAVAALAAAQAVSAQPPRAGGGRGAPLPAGTTPGADVSLGWRDPVLRLVRRLTMGLSPDEVARARQLGFSGYLEYQLNPAAIDDSVVDTLLATRLPMLAMTGAALRTQDRTEVMNQLADAAWYRALFSRKQLYERMVEFWTDHFSIDIEVGNVGFNKLLDDRDVIRRHAMGNFRDLLKASAQSAAMLNYLNQNSSRTPTPNQNYAREIMELHTLGVDGGYTQTDVAELSRILTGWSTNTDGTFLWRRTYHDRNAKTFLGQLFPGMASTATDVEMKGEGDRAIDMLLAHPSTARFVSTKMARWLLSYEPPASVIDATAATFTRTGGDIRAMIRTIVTSKNLMAAPAKYKRPFHLAISAMRALGATPATVPNVRNARRNNEGLGMPLFRWDQPDGFPDSIAWWSGLVLSRWTHMQYLSAQTSTTTYRSDSMLFRAPDNADGVVQQITTRLFAGEMPTALRASLLSYLRGGTYNDARVRETLSLAMSANEFQWY
ncbi:DUF1800 domain-containing protein [Gemmatimonas phototrophica]|uniref:DUF1800 domain-containing protein n=1 Tax=Gemmatimonas phototrophica TaxID=1379270 RepID=A0A143BHL1_9BACT|nr:DUF1800 domain-containing protein [Gemmatimonas phototrophica]AMW04536.1 hypothetical protein GEMMAAP_06130 [Gemmatimonas phototrophica]